MGKKNNNTNNTWGRYHNGNYEVLLNKKTGTKIKFNKENSLIPDTIDNFDYKITQYCENNCPYCFESSSIEGKHGDIMHQKFINTLHPYTEIAIGGGNPLSHPDLIPFLKKCKKLNLIPSITVNQIDFEKSQELIKQLVNEELIYGIGVSLVDATDNFISLISQYSNAVIHIINGVVTEEQINKLSNHNLKILILGYKEVGRGKSLYNSESANRIIENRKSMLKNSLSYMLKGGTFNVISFDNRAIKQLDVKSLITQEQWDTFFMGDDGIDGDYTSTSMFIDGVKQEFTINSCCDKRFPLMNNIKSMFKKIQEEFGNKS